MLLDRKLNLHNEELQLLGKESAKKNYQTPNQSETLYDDFQVDIKVHVVCYYVLLSRIEIILDETELR